jgi:hypothetical protein
MKKVLLFLMLASCAIAQPPNYFYTTLTATITSTDTTCAINPTDTAYFGSASNFYATIYDTYYSSPAHARSRGGLYETVLIESRSGLTLQIVRARLGTTARNFNVTGRTYRLEATILNDIYDSLEVTRYTDSIDAHRSALNKLTDSITAHNTRINASTQRSMDSISAHRTYMGANRDLINSTIDTTEALRDDLDLILPVTSQLMNSYLFNEEFETGSTTTGTIGTYRWAILTNGATLAVTYNTTALTDENVGTVRLVKSGASDQCGLYVVGGSSAQWVKYNAPYLQYKTRVSTVSADSTNKSVLHGIVYNSAGAVSSPDAGIYFTSTDGNWNAVTRQNSSDATITKTGVAPTVNWQTLSYTVNSDGTVVRFYIDGNLVATHNSFIPTGYGSPWVTTGSISGTSAITIDVDYVKISIPDLQD